MITTERKAEIIRNAIISRIPRPEGEGFNLSAEEADFLWACTGGVDGVVQRIVEVVEEGAAQLAASMDATPKLPGR